MDLRCSIGRSSPSGAKRESRCTSGPDPPGPRVRALAHRRDDPVEYVCFRVDGHAVVLNLSEYQRLTPARSLDLVNHSLNGQPRHPT